MPDAIQTQFALLNPLVASMTREFSLLSTNHSNVDS
jgi:hypothetical protein